MKKRRFAFVQHRWAVQRKFVLSALLGCIVGMASVGEECFADPYPAASSDLVVRDHS